MLANPKALYYGPPWSERVTRDKSIVTRVQNLLCYYFPKGLTVYQIEDLLKLSTQQVYSALAYLRKHTILVIYRNASMNIKFITDRVLYHILRGENLKAKQTYSWMIEQLPELAKQVIEDLANKYEPYATKSNIISLEKYKHSKIQALDNPNDKLRKMTTLFYGLKQL